MIQALGFSLQNDFTILYLVKEWLKTQDTYTRHKPIVRKHKFQRTFVKDLADQIQMDLVDMGKYKNQNKG